MIDAYRGISQREIDKWRFLLTDSGNIEYGAHYCHQ